MLGEHLEVFNPIDAGQRVTTISKLKETYRMTNEIIENLDDLAIKELCDGNEGDIDKVMEAMLQETYAVLYGNQGFVKESSFEYLNKLSSTVEETLRIENFNYFLTSVLQDFEINWHHLEWGDLLMQHMSLCVLAPRDHGKSFFFSNAYIVWKMYRYRSEKDFFNRKRKDLALSRRGFLITNEIDLGEDLMEILQTTIEEVPALREKLYPNKADHWNKRSIRCKNGARLGLKSYGGSFRGRHPGYIVVDDFLKDNVIYSETQRKKATNYFHAVIMNAILPKGQVIVVGTPFHETDLYGDLKTKVSKKGWKVFEYPGIYPDGRILWPSRYTYEDLIGKKETQGNIIFSREILVRPIVSDSSIFPFEILRRAFVGMDLYTLVKNRESFPIKFNKVVTGCDLAISASVGADYSVFTTWGIDNEDNMWLLHIWRGKGKHYLEQIAILKSINMNFQPDAIYMESNQFQDVMADMAEESGLPVFPHHTGTNKYDFKHGLPGVALLFQRAKIRFPRGDQYSIDMTDLICSEFASVTWTDKGLEGVGEHDDCPMSTWLGSLAAKHVTQGFGISFI